MITRSNTPSLLRGSSRVHEQPTKSNPEIRRNEELKRTRKAPSHFIDPAEFGPNNDKSGRRPHQFDEDKITYGSWVEDSMGKPDAFKRTHKARRMEDFFKD